MWHFIYTPKSGSKILSGSIHTPVVTWQNWSHHVWAPGGVDVVEAAYAGTWWRHRAQQVARRLSQVLGGVATDERGAVAYYAPTDEASRVARAAFARFSPFPQENAPIHLEQWLRGEPGMSDADLMSALSGCPVRPPAVGIYPCPDGVGSFIAVRDGSFVSECSYKWECPYRIEGLDQRVQMETIIALRGENDADAILAASQKQDSGINPLDFFDHSDT